MKLIYIFIFSFSSLFLWSQERAVKKDSIKSHNPVNLFIGVDIANPIIGFLSDKKQYEVFASIKLKKRWYASLEIGQESNTFTDLGWDVKSNGIYGRIGVDYHMSNDYENKENSFYIGPRLAYSRFTQDVLQYPVNESIDDPFIYDEYGSLPSSSGSAYWFEIAVGGRVQLWKSNFYLEGQAKPKYIISQKVDDGLDALVIPGFGKDLGNFNIGFMVGISYKITLKK